MQNFSLENFKKIVRQSIWTTKMYSAFLREQYHLNKTSMLNTLLQVKDVPCGLVDLNSLHIHKGINQMELKQDFLFLGNGVFKYIYKCDFLITSSNGDVTVQSRNAWGPIESLAGSFGSVATDASGKQCYVITNKEDTETVRAYKVGDDPKTSVQSVNLKEAVTVLGIIVQNESTLLLVGKNVKNCLCAIELKESRSRQRRKEGETDRNQADSSVKRKEEYRNERNSCVILWYRYNYMYTSVD